MGERPSHGGERSASRGYKPTYDLVYTLDNTLRPSYHLIYGRCHHEVGLALGSMLERPAEHVQKVRTLHTVPVVNASCLELIEERARRQANEKATRWPTQ